MILCLLRVLLLLLPLISCLPVQVDIVSPEPLPTIIIDISAMSDADIVTELMNEAKSEHVLAVCGPHPLQAILDKVEGKMEHEEVVKLLSSIRYKAPRLWRAYEHALRKYTSCKLIAGGGTLG